jgi:hypothetical protein
MLYFTRAWNQKKRSYKTRYKRESLKQPILSPVRLPKLDRITYVYARDKTSETIREVSNVSYDAWIKKRWITILRYDSAHGYLHQHTLFSLTQRKEFIGKEHILQESTQQDWLTFAIGERKTSKNSWNNIFLALLDSPFRAS